MQEQRANSDASAPDPPGTVGPVPNIVARVLHILNELVRQSGYQGPPLFPVIESPAFPPWVICVCGKLNKTVFKTASTPVVGNELDFYLLGKLIGALLRLGHTFSVEVPAELDKLKVDELPKEKRDQIEKALDLTPVRPSLAACRT